MTQLVSFIAIIESHSFRTFRTTKCGDETYKTIQEYPSASVSEKIINEDKLSSRRSFSPVTRKLLNNTELFETFETRNKLKNINEKLEEALSVKDY